MCCYTFLWCCKQLFPLSKVIISYSLLNKTIVIYADNQKKNKRKFRAKLIDHLVVYRPLKWPFFLAVRNSRGDTPLEPTRKTACVRTRLELQVAKPKYCTRYPQIGISLISFVKSFREKKKRWKTFCHFFFWKSYVIHIFTHENVFLFLSFSILSI